MADCLGGRHRISLKLSIRSTSPSYMANLYHRCVRVVFDSFVQMEGPKNETGSFSRCLLEGCYCNAVYTFVACQPP